ncbi:MAG: STAS domain-containing protein [Thermoleophilaceae bacterium]|nr:STAS domain-containing protein [Thermoleophilaceae bacterium]
MTLVQVVDDGTEVVLGRADERRLDLALVDALARMQLTARGRTCLLRLRGVSEELRELIELVGLADVLILEPRREAELGKQLGVEKVVQPGDPPG